MESRSCPFDSIFLTVCVSACVETVLSASAEGVKAEAAYAKDKTLPDPTSTDNPEFQIVLAIIKEGLPKNPTKWTEMAKEMEGVSEETTTGVKRLYEMQVWLGCMRHVIYAGCLPLLATGAAKWTPAATTAPGFCVA